MNSGQRGGTTWVLSEGWEAESSGECSVWFPAFYVHRLLSQQKYSILSFQQSPVMLVSQLQRVVV